MTAEDIPHDDRFGNYKPVNSECVFSYTSKRGNAKYVFILVTKPLVKGRNDYTQM